MLPDSVVIIYPEGVPLRRRRAYRPPQPKRLPLALIQSYAVELRRLVNEYAAEVRSLFDEHLAEIERAADTTRPQRQDSYSDLIDRLMRAMEEVAARVFAARTGRALARRVATRASDWDKRETSRQLLRSIGVDLVSGEPWLQDHLNAFVRDNVALIQSIPVRHAQEVQRIVYDGFRSARRVEDIRAELMQRFDVSKSRADLIARDQVLKLNSQLDTLRQRAIGVQRQRWATSRDERVRKRHQQVNKRIYPIDDPPPAGPKGARVRPGQDFQCRCQALPVLEDLLQDVQESSGDLHRFAPAAEPRQLPLQLPAPGVTYEESSAAHRAQAAGLEEAFYVAVKEEDGGAARGALRSAIRHGLGEGVRSTDVALGRVHRDELLVDEEVRSHIAFHDHLGRVTMGSDFVEGLRKRDRAYYHTMLHEELHGFTRPRNDYDLNPDSNPAFEEWVVESLTRRVLRRAFGGEVSNRAAREAPWGFSGQPQHPYTPYIVRARAAVQRVAKRHGKNWGVLEAQERIDRAMLHDLAYVDVTTTDIRLRALCTELAEGDKAFANELVFEVEKALIEARRQGGTVRIDR